MPIDVVMAVDYWEPAVRSYRLNHPGTEVILADLSDPDFIILILEKAKAVGIDLILGGIPCEWLSSYRVLSKVESPELIKERALLASCLDLVHRISPRYWCLEDVKQLARELPIMTPWREINARNYSAQRRKRIFVGWFPEPIAGGCSDTLRHKLRQGPYRIGRRGFDRAPQLSRTFNNKTCLAAMPDRKAPTVCANCSRRDAELLVVDPDIAGGKRQMEWQEMSDLQGFPTDYVFYGSPTDVSKMVGRAVQIDTARAILQGIVRDWEAHAH
jgi:site-specific DNA-cytosine methylase